MIWRRRVSTVGTAIRRAPAISFGVFRLGNALERLALATAQRARLP